MTKAPFVLDHTTKNCPPEGVNDPSRSAGGRKAAEHSGQRTRRRPLRAATRSPFSLPFKRRKVGVRTSHTTAAERLSSTRLNAVRQFAPPQGPLPNSAP